MALNATLTAGFSAIEVWIPMAANAFPASAGPATIPWPRNRTWEVVMKIAVIHDYADVFRRTRAYPRLAGHEVIVHTDAYTDPARVVEQAAGCEALLLTQQRVPITRSIVERQPALKFISQTGRNASHLDLAACTDNGIRVSAG